MSLVEFGRIDEEPLVSIIMPVYNAEKFLKKSIDSVLSQTYKNFELILVNDGSKDLSGSICEKYAKEDLRIRVLHQENLGASAARNNGIKSARYSYICFLDSDDWFSERAIETLVGLMKKYNSDICMIPILETRTEEVVFSPSDEEVEFSPDECLANIFFDHLNFVQPCNKLYKKYLFEKIKYPEGRIYEDEYIVAEMMAQIKKLVLSKKACMFYRTSFESVTRSKFSKKKLQEYDAMENLGHTIKSLGREDLFQINLSRLLNYCIWAYIKVGQTDWPDKSELQNNFKKRLLNVVRQKTTWSFKDIKRYFTFKISPKLYEIFNYQKFR